MLQRKCKICTKKFYVKPFSIKKGWGVHCSRNCKHKGQIKGKTVSCVTCDKAVHRTPTDLSRSKSKKFFCNKSCFAVWKNKTMFVGKNHAEWRGGKSTYRATMLRREDKPECDSCGLDDIRILLVHHIDSNRWNNNISNLKWLCHNCHYLEHEGKTI